MQKRLQEWISLREVARRLDINPMSVYKLLATGEIRYRDLPGLVQRRYSASDVEAVARKYVTSGRPS